MPHHKCEFRHDTKWMEEDVMQVFGLELVTEYFEQQYSSGFINKQINVFLQCHTETMPKNVWHL